MRRSVDRARTCWSASSHVEISIFGLGTGASIGSFTSGGGGSWPGTGAGDVAWFVGGAVTGCVPGGVFTGTFGCRSGCAGAGCAEAGCAKTTGAKANAARPHKREMRDMRDHVVGKKEDDFGRSMIGMGGIMAARRASGRDYSRRPLK